jgi:hypothetical protein
MSDAPLHRLYHHFSELPYSLRVLYTAVLVILSIGYLFALIYLFHTYAGRDGNAGSLSYEDLVVAYTGSGEASRLESALRGPMSTMLPPDELKTVVQWAQQGADRSQYESVIRPVLDERCLTCHDGSNPHLVNLDGYDKMSAVTQQDTGADIFTLVRVSHIHLFGISFIFFILGLIFSHAYVRPVWFKCAVIALPFVAVMADVSSWYFTKLYHPFAWVVMCAGATMGLCFAFMWIVSMYQMWLSPMPSKVASRGSSDNRDVG